LLKMLAKLLQDIVVVACHEIVSTIEFNSYIA
jgi:hypothetical protein